MNSAERAGLRPKGNVPNKREQSQTCINSAERAGLRPKGNVPTLRFPEFSGEYEITRIGKLTNKVGSGVTPKGGESVYTSEGHPFVRSQNVGNGQMFLDDIAYIDEDTHNKQIATEIKHGDVLLNITGASIGRCCVASDFVVGGNVNQHVCIVRPTQDVTSYYLCSLLLSDKGQKQIDSFQAGGNRQGLNFEQIKSFKFSIPKLSEQMKVSELLTLVDERITTQIRIIDKLKSLMRGLNDELMDNPKWTKVYVGDFMEFFPTNSLSWEKLSYDDGQVRNLHYGLIHSGLPTLVDCQKESLPYVQDRSLPKQYTDCKDGDVAFADASEDTAEVGKVVELTNIDDKKIVCGLHTIHGRDVKGMTVKGFKGFAFNSKYFHDQLRRIAQGSKVYSINTDNVKSCYIYIPTIDEQQKIVGLLCCMQEKMGIAEEELRQYTIQKQFLLKGLFV